MRQVYKIVEDPEGHQRRVRNMSEIHRGGDEAELLERRRLAVETMRASRAAFVAELESIPPIAAFRNDKWSVIHILWHLGARGSHMDAAREILAGATEVHGVPKREDRMAEAIGYTLQEIDESIALAESLSAEQLAMSAKRQRRDVYVIGVVEGTAEHFDDHLQQLREVKRELGLPLAVAAASL